MVIDRLDPPELLRIPEMVNASVATGSRIIHISGQTSVDAEGRVVGTTYREQTRRALENLIVALSAAGATPADVAKYTTYLTNYSWEALEGFMAGAKDVLGENSPVTANTVVGVAALWLPELVVEIEAVAVV